MKTNKFALALSAVQARLSNQNPLLVPDPSARDNEVVKHVLFNEWHTDREQGRNTLQSIFQDEVVDRIPEYTKNSYLWDSEIKQEKEYLYSEKQRLLSSYHLIKQNDLRLATQISYFSWLICQMYNLEHIDKALYDQFLNQCSELACKYFNSWEDFAISLYYEIYSQNHLNKENFNESLILDLLYNPDSPWQQTPWPQKKE